jgi:hypothetical protein
MSKSIPKKLQLLMRSFGITSEEFAAKFSRLHRTRKAVVKEWLDGTQQVSGGSIGKLTKFWMAYVPTINDACWIKDESAFEAQVIECIAGSGLLTFEVPFKLRTLEKLEAKALPGKYRVYRYAYKNNGEVALEWMVIDETADSSYVQVRLFSVSVNDVRQIDRGRNVSDREIQSRKIEEVEFDYELFQGRMYRLGDAYVGILAYKDGELGVRTRTLEFAVAERGAFPSEWWGLLTGVGARSLRPTCASLVAVRASPATLPKTNYEITEDELKQVRYGMIEDVPRPYRADISNDIRSVPARNEPPPNGTGDYVLMAGRRRSNNLPT